MLHVGLLHGNGNGDAIDDTLSRLLGRRPTTFERYLRDHLHLWQPDNGQSATPSEPETTRTASPDSTTRSPRMVQNSSPLRGPT